MAYCTNSDVLREFKTLAYNSSTIASTDADTFIAEADAYIDARIGLKFVTPVTGASSLIILRTISVWLVADRIAAILKLKTGKQNIEEFQEKEISLRQKAEHMLKLIVEGKLALSDATLLKTNDGVESYTYEEDFEHEFERGVDQW